MMIQDEKPRSRYEERLLAELRALAVQNAEAPRRGGAAVRRRRPKLIVAAVAGGACVASALIAFTGGGGGSTAYAVEPHEDGSVTVEINKLQDAAGLERQLRANGIPAEVDYLPPGLTCREPRFQPASPGGRSTGGLQHRDDGSFSFTVGANELRPGQTLVIMSSEAAPAGGKRPATSMAIAVAQGKVAPCEPVKAPASEGTTPNGAGAPATPRLDEGGTSTGRDKAGTNSVQE